MEFVLCFFFLCEITIFTILPWHPGRRGGTLPHAGPSSTGSSERPSPSTCSSSCCWSWPAWCLCPRRTTAAHCPTTSPAPSTPCCATPTAPRPHENWNTRPRVTEIQHGPCSSVKVQLQTHLHLPQEKKHGLHVWRPHLVCFLTKFFVYLKAYLLFVELRSYKKKKKPYHWFVLKVCHFSM